MEKIIRTFWPTQHNSYTRHTHHCLGFSLWIFLEEPTLLTEVQDQHNLFVFFKVYFIDYAVTVVPFLFSPLFPLLCMPPPTSIPPLVYVHGSYI